LLEFTGTVGACAVIGLRAAATPAAALLTQAEVAALVAVTPFPDDPEPLELLELHAASAVAVSAAAAKMAAVRLFVR
jgi:hypothetical protein